MVADSLGCNQNSLGIDRLLMAGLEALDRGSVRRKRSIDDQFYRLRDRGLLRRVPKVPNTISAIYFRVGVDVPMRSFENMTLAESIREVLGDRQMAAIELALRLLESRYETTMNPKL